MLILLGIAGLTPKEREKKYIAMMRIFIRIEKILRIQMKMVICLLLKKIKMIRLLMELLDSKRLKLSVKKLKINWVYRKEGEKSKETI